MHPPCDICHPPKMPSTLLFLPPLPRCHTPCDSCHLLRYAVPLILWLHPRCYVPTPFDSFYPPPQGSMHPPCDFCNPPPPKMPCPRSDSSIIWCPATWTAWCHPLMPCKLSSVMPPFDALYLLLHDYFFWSLAQFLLFISSTLSYAMHGMSCTRSHPFLPLDFFHVHLHNSTVWCPAPPHLHNSTIWYLPLLNFSSLMLSTLNNFIIDAIHPLVHSSTIWYPLPSTT